MILSDLLISCFVVGVVTRRAAGTGTRRPRIPSSSTGREPGIQPVCPSLASPMFRGQDLLFRISAICSNSSFDSLLITNGGHLWCSSPDKVDTYVRNRIRLQMTEGQNRVRTDQVVPMSGRRPPAATNNYTVTARHYRPKPPDPNIIECVNNYRYI